jgi:hypothetical protein
MLLLLLSKYYGHLRGCVLFRLTIGKLKLKLLQWRVQEKTTVVAQKVTPYRKGYVYIYFSTILFETTTSIYQFSVSPLYVQSSVLQKNKVKQLARFYFLFISIHGSYYES